MGILWIPFLHSQVQFTTHLNDDLEKPVFKKGAAFVFKYQAVTSESESKVRVFSPFPKLPEINITKAIATVASFKQAQSWITNVWINNHCKFEFNNTYAILVDQLVTRIKNLQLELAAAQKDQTTLLEVANSFIPPQLKRKSKDPNRQRRAIGAIAAIAAGAGLVLGEPIKDAACNALSIFNLCHNNDDLVKDVNSIMAQQKYQTETLKRVQTHNDKNFFLLGNEIKSTQESLQKLKEAVGDRFDQMEHYVANATSYLVSFIVKCDDMINRYIHLSQVLRNYVYQLGTLYTHLKSYRAAFYAFRISLFSTISSLAGGYITPQFLLPQQIAQIVTDLANDEVLRGTKLSPAIRPGYEAIYYEIQLVLEVTLLPSGISVILGIPMNSKSSNFDIYHATPLYQPNNDQKTASLYGFANPFLAISTDNTRFAELGANTLQQCSGNNRIRLCRKGFSTTTDETLLCLGSLFYNYNIPALRNCEVKSVLLPDAPQAFYLAEGMYHIISREPTLQIKNDSRANGLSISTINCQACVMRPSCTSVISFNQGDLVLYPDMDFCETSPEPFLATIELTPALDQVFSHVPSINGSADFQAYSAGEARQAVLGSLRMELAELPDVQHMTQETLDQLTKPIAQYYSSISPATSAALASYLPTRTAVLLSSLSITMSLLTFSISFTLFRRQWRRLFTHPQKFFRSSNGRFIQIVDTSPEYETSDAAFMYLTSAEFRALISLARETLQQVAKPDAEYTTPDAPRLPNRIYPNVVGPHYADTHA